jgi:WS/DGAT/MGAT family acyltransferase
VKAPNHGTEHDLLSVAAPVAMSGFDRARPQWRAVVVEGLSGGRMGIVLKLHHAITDGVGGVKLQLEMLELDSEAAERPMPPSPQVHVLSQPERVIDAIHHERRRQFGMWKRLAPNAVSGLGHALSDPLGVAQSSAEMVGSVARVLRPATHPMSPLMTSRSLSYRFDTLTISLERTKKAAKLVGGTVNDAFVAGVLRGLYRYHLHHGVDCDRLRVGLPINIRRSESEVVAGNAFVPARIEVAIDQEDPRETMLDVHESVAGARHERANELVDPLASVLSRLPTSATTALFGSMVRSVDVTASNVPGPPFPVYLRGARLLAEYPFGPLAGAAVNVTTLSYVDDLNIGINSDPEAVPDTHLLTECLRSGFDEILSLV